MNGVFAGKPIYFGIPKFKSTLEVSGVSMCPMNGYAVFVVLDGVLFGVFAPRYIL